jgi:hypothetical protein
LNTETVLNNAELQAYGYRAQGTAFTEQAGLEQMEANEAPIAANLATAGGEYAAAGAEEGACGQPVVERQRYRLQIGGLNPLSSNSSSAGTGLAGSSWGLNFG